jgi:hypothetical protein
MAKRAKKAVGKAKAGKKSGKTLTDLDVSRVSGGIKGGKAKTADKAFQAMDGYIRG